MFLSTEMEMMHLFRLLLVVSPLVDGLSRPLFEVSFDFDVILGCPMDSISKASPSTVEVPSVTTTTASSTPKTTPPISTTESSWFPPNINIFVNKHAAEEVPTTTKTAVASSTTAPPINVTPSWSPPPISIIVNQTPAHKPTPSDSDSDDDSDYSILDSISDYFY